MGLTRHSRDVISGGTVLLAGALTIAHTMASYTIGSLTRPGPGLFPFVLAVALALLGFFTLWRGLKGRDDAAVAIELAPAAAVLASIAAFALLIRPFGLVPAITALTVIAVLPDPRTGWIGAIVLAGTLSLLAYLIFVAMLAMPISIAAWPF